LVVQKNIFKISDLRLGENRNMVYKGMCSVAE
jgi:hypothetical protein